MTKKRLRLTRKDLIDTLRFLAVMPQAYYSRGPEWIVREMEQVAREAIRYAMGPPR